ncbi:MAG TPA: hypothetical protein PLG66_15730, partial [Calditrichia bacterium]|nr:hypothetical protein [Calditrichia bacterium]
LYEDFLLFLKENYAGQYWNPLPREAARYVRGMAENPPDASPGINTMLLPFIVNLREILSFIPQEILIGAA